MTTAVPDTFDGDIDYAMLVKEFGSAPKPENTRYSPSPGKSITIKKVTGAPDPAHISTSYVERQRGRAARRAAGGGGAEVTLVGLQAGYRRHRGPGDGAPVSMQQLRELVDLAGQVSEDVPGHSPVTREHLAARTRRGQAHRR